MILSAFHIMLKPLGKVWIQLFSLQLCWSWVDWVLWYRNQFFGIGTSREERKVWIQIPPKISLVSYSACAEMLGKYILYIYKLNCESGLSYYGSSGYQAPTNDNRWKLIFIKRKTHILENLHKTKKKNTQKNTDFIVKFITLKFDIKKNPLPTKSGTNT